ncbi:MAG: hypothetical protein EOM64_00665 [Erysipelotrichia bacterium]|nr:hypothetical protein [Erysipelotrichia bacterium]
MELSSAAIIAVIIIALALYQTWNKKQKMKERVENGNEEYHVPLSPDVQHIYYDEYDKEIKRQKEKEERDKAQAEQEALDEAEFQKNRNKSQAESMPPVHSENNENQ